MTAVAALSDHCFSENSPLVDRFVTCYRA